MNPETHTPEPKRRKEIMAVEISSLSDGVIPLGELPEGCIAKTLSLTNPREACRLSLVASVFRSAAESDYVWELFLPPDYPGILGRSAVGVNLLRSPISRKELFLRLCDNPILIDGGTKSFSLEKSSVKSASYGFGQPPAEASVGFSGQEGEKKAVLLDPRMMGLGPPGVVGQQETDDVTHVQHAKQRDDRWMEVELGEVFIDGVEDADLEISLMEIKGGHWKSGLVIEGIEIRPKKGN